MKKEEFVFTDDGFESFVKLMKSRFEGFIIFLAARLGVGHEDEDIIQGFWVRVIENWSRIVSAKSPIHFVYWIAKSAVYNTSYGDKVRIHLSLVPEADVFAFLISHHLEHAFTALVKPGPLGLPVLSGLVWRSKIDELNSHPDVAFLAIRDYSRFESVEDLQIPDSKESVDSIETKAELRHCLELISKRLPRTRRLVLYHCDCRGLPESVVARRLGLKISVVRRYRTDGWAALRAEFPWLKDCI